MKTFELTYQEGGENFIGYVAQNESESKPRPVVLIAHAFEGRNQLAKELAEHVAGLGYIGFAIDMYGEAKTGNNVEESMALMMPCWKDRALLRRRINAAFTAAKTIPGANPSHIGGIGFCFGGMCLLDLARSGADVKGIISCHGVFAKPENIPNETITAKVLAIHGYDDPQVPPAQFTVFADEMNTAGVDWQMLYLGNVKHAFTDPNATEAEMGREYNQQATARTLKMAQTFFAEIFE